eukprot:7727792-Lingulodinium_polyedra.AAC.1
MLPRRLSTISRIRPSGFPTPKVPFTIGGSSSKNPPKIPLSTHTVQTRANSSMLHPREIRIDFCKIRSAGLSVRTILLSSFKIAPQEGGSKFSTSTWPPSPGPGKAKRAATNGS